MLRAVLDTNVLVAGLRSRQGAAFQLLHHVRAGLLVPVVSVPLFCEYHDVLTRPSLLPGETPASVGRFLDALAGLIEPHEIYFLWRPLLPDPDDEMLVEVAFAAGVPLVTHNVRDFSPAVRRLGLRVLTPASALTMLGGSLPSP